MQGAIRDDNIAEPAIDFRDFVNNALAAISSWQAGSTPPSNPQPGMVWIDTSTTPPTIRQRSMDNTSWIQVAQLTASWGLNNAATIVNTLNQLLASGTTPTIEDKFAVNGWFNVKSYGAKGDGAFLHDAVTSGSNITCATTTPFTGRAGQTILIPGAKSANLTNSTATGTTVLFGPRGSASQNRMSVTNRIAFASPGTITDSGNGFNTAGFEPGELLFVTDGSGGNNTGIYLILTVPSAGTLTVGRLLSTTIASVTDSAHAVLTDAADNAVTVASTWSAGTPFVATDDYASIQAAIDAAEGSNSGAGGGVVHSPEGYYYLSAGLVNQDGPIHFIGAHGMGIAGGSGATNHRMEIQAGTIFVSAANAPIIKHTAADKSVDYPAMWSSFEDFAVLGFSMQGADWPSAQHGVQLDTRGVNLRNVSAFRCGQRGFYLSDVVDACFQLCAANYNYGDGFQLDGHAAIATGGGVTSTTFLACTALSNFSNGVRFEGGTVNCRWIGGSVERNAEHGFLFDQSFGGFPITAHNSVWGVHEELNNLGSVNFRAASGLVQSNEVHGRWSTAPIFGLSYAGNTVSGIIQTDPATVMPRTGIRKLISAGKHNSSDDYHLSIRKYDDSDDEVVQCDSLIITRGVTDSPDNLNALGVKVLSGSGSPESAVTAPTGSLYMRLNGGANTTLYVKESGTGNTGWVAK